MEKTSHKEEWCAEKKTRHLEPLVLQRSAEDKKLMLKFFREYIREPTFGSGKVSKILKKNGLRLRIWFVWFWDCSCERGTCGGVIMIKVVIGTLGLTTIH